MALKHFITHKNNFESNLANEKSGLSIKKFLRMISFTLTDLLINFPILLTEFSMELAYAQIKPYTSWDVVHADFKRLWSILYMRFQIFVVSVSWPYQRSVHGHYVFAHLFFLGFLE